MQVSARRWGPLAAFLLLFTLPQALSAAEPCKLLTEQEIGQVLGSLVSPPTPIGTTGCFWGGVQHVSIVLRPATSWARVTMPVSGITKTSISGFGEAASISHSETGSDKTMTLSVKQGANVMVLTVSGVKDTERVRSAEESLARLALPRL